MQKLETASPKLSFLNLSYGKLSEEVVDRVKYLTLDFIGLASRGSLFTSSKPLQTFIEKFGGDGDGTIIGNKELSSLPQYAALANGAAAHSLELDDVINESSLHPAVSVFPAAFAVGEEANRSGKDFIVASLIGYELMSRLGVALNPSEVYKKGFHPTGLMGTFAASVTSSKLLNLSTEKTYNAIGIAGSQTSSSMEFLQTGAWTKRLHPGWAAQSGIIAAQLAAEGFTGPDTIIEGNSGFAQAHSDNYDLTQLDNSFDMNENAILKTSIKPHACCRYKQGPLDLILDIVKENNLVPSDINQINVYLVGTALPIVAEPAAEKRRPKSSVDAQFSMHFGAAVATIYRNTLLEQYDETVIRDSNVISMMDKVTCVRDEDLEEYFPTKWPARVVIDSKKGLFEKKIDYPKGDPENPLSWDEIINKFRYVTSPIYSEKQQTAIIDKVRDLENLKGIKELGNLL
ncbi:MmgE/PrpD family protein [Lentibacillus jeotgali]|uniref:MmgE/PrpD family protein n=1 Tax=Lentibacillus jeotgali TaxID=558169 RepID=UPI00026283FC|nr:MmgE/PrpD family protein [Lentibacillus jeotgali]